METFASLETRLQIINSSCSEPDSDQPSSLVASVTIPQISGQSVFVSHSFPTPPSWYRHAYPSFNISILS